MNILAIGNSFSEDATQMLHSLAEAAGFDTKVVNLYIGGCSLELHADNIKSNKKDYWYFLNGKLINKASSVNETLLEENWDIVTIQQASPLSGRLESYYPYADTVIKAIKSAAANAKVYFHQTWAYEINSDHPGFAYYDNSQQKMHNAIIKASYQFARDNNLPLIKCGEVFEKLRKQPEFDFSSGGESLNRDGFHASLDYGRYALAAAWFETLTEHSIYESDFIPDNTDPKKLETIKKCVHKICF